MSELFEDLDPQIAGPLQRITEALRAEIGSQIDGVRQDVQSLLGAEAGAARESDSMGRQAQKPASDQLDALEELKHAAAGIDRATKQASILEALLEGAGRFSSRAAFVLIRDDGQRCWGSLGFDDAARELKGASVEVPNGASAWARVQDGAGTRGLSSEECAIFCSQFEASTPDVGALLPLSLGDHVAGYLYADRLGDGSLNITALQLLTFVAGQTLETLPLRKRSSTPTLVVADAAVEAAPEVEPVADAAPEAAPAAPSEATFGAPPPPAAEPVEEIPVVESEPEATLEAEAETIVDSEPGETLVDTAPEGMLETIPVDVVPEEDETEPRAPDFPAEPDEDTETLVPPAEPETGPRLYEAGQAAEPAAPIEVEEVEPLESAPTAEMPLPSQDATEVAAEPDIQPATPAPEPEAPTPPPALQADGSSTQVLPPEDVLGPGWAFTSKENVDETGNEALHEEAKRLARLLVTEIKLYNEEQVDQGRRSGDIYRRLQEDIDRSRQIFEDRIDEQVRADNDYFRDALVRILAGGDDSLLGA